MQEHEVKQIVAHAPAVVPKVQQPWGVVAIVRGDTF
jgi:hypothetical protein